jgi:sugar porter (SP) family MFS transporter
MARSKTTHVVFIASAAALGGFLFGFDTAIINGTVSALKQYFDADAVQIGLAVSLALLGSALGAFFAGQLADRIGRVRVMLLASVAFTLSALGSGMPFGLADFVFWRILGGVAVGAASVIAPAYIAEVAPAHMRGRLGSLQQLAIVIGIFVALLINYVFSASAGSAENPWLLGQEAWRWMFWSEIPVAVIYGIAALMIPESPRFLVAKGRAEEAARVLDSVGAGDPKTIVAEIQATVRTDKRPSLALLKGKSFGLLPIVWVGIGLSALQQFVGINVIFYYSSMLWQAVGFSESDALMITVVTGITNVVTTFVGIAFVDKFGRKPLLLVGSIVMALMLGTMAYIFGMAPIGADGNPILTETTGLIAGIAANVYVFGFGFSWGPMVWVLLGEMFNNQIRGAALSIAASVQWVANFLVSTSFPPLLESIGLGASYGVYTFFALLSFFFVSRYVRETKGMTLEQM